MRMYYEGKKEEVIMFFYGNVVFYVKVLFVFVILYNIVGKNKYVVGELFFFGVWSKVVSFCCVLIIILRVEILMFCILFCNFVYIYCKKIVFKR